MRYNLPLQYSFVCMTLIAGILLCMALPALAGNAIIKNLSFEDGLLSWELFNARLDETPGAARSGSACVTGQVPAQTNKYSGVRRHVFLERGAEYKLTFWARSETGNAVGAVWADADTESDNRLLLVTGAIPTEWTMYEVKFRARRLDTSFDIHVPQTWIGTGIVGGAKAEKAWMDDISMWRTESPIELPAKPMKAYKLYFSDPRTSTCDKQVQDSKDDSLKTPYNAGVLDSAMFADHGEHMDRNDWSIQKSIISVDFVPAAYSTDLTREAIFDAILHKRCYAAVDPTALLDFRVDGHLMGETIAAEPRKSPHKIAIRVETQSPIESLALIRNGKEIQTFNEAAGKKKFDITYVDQHPDKAPTIGNPPEKTVYYYARVIERTERKTNSGEPYKHMAWSSPVWITLAVPAYSKHRK